MEFSPTKNMVLCPTQRLASKIHGHFLGFKVLESAESLGGAISSGRYRAIAILSKRRVFKIRKVPFQKQRRMIGASRIAVVLRTGGTAALAFGQANTVVSCSTPRCQRSAVAAASVPGGSGELELVVVLADGLFRG